MKRERDGRHAAYVVLSYKCSTDRDGRGCRMSREIIDGVLKEKLWLLMKEKSKEEEGDMKELFNVTYETAQTHLMDVMREIYENDVELFTEFFE